MRANDIVCIDTRKTRIELDLDILYGGIVYNLEKILELCGLNKDFISNKLDNNELSQTDFDYALMGLIETIKGYKKD